MEVDHDPRVDRALSESMSDGEATLLYAVDYGSHDALLMGPDSDRDVAYIAAYHPLEYGRSSDPPSRFHSTYEIEGQTINLAGLSLSQFATAAAESDSEAITIAAADRIYSVAAPVEDSVSALLTHLRDQFCPSTLIAHFRRLARSNYRYATSDDWEYTGEDGPQWTIEERGDQKYLITGLLGYPDQMVSRPVSEAIDEGVLDHKKSEPTVRQNLRIARALLSAEHIFDTGRLPPSDFEILVEERLAAERNPRRGYEPLSDKVAKTLVDLAERKRAGEGDEPVGLVIGEWVTPIIDSDEFSIRQGEIRSNLRDSSTETPAERTPDQSAVDAAVDDIRRQLFLN